MTTWKMIRDIRYTITSEAYDKIINIRISLNQRLDELEKRISSATPTASPLPDHVWCRFSGPGRGDCAHFIGLPGKSIPGQHDGPDDTVDVYGIPNGWCEYCWKSHQLEQAENRIEKLSELLECARKELDVIQRYDPCASGELSGPMNH